MTKIVFLAPTVGLNFLRLMPKNRLTKSIIQRDIRQELPDRGSGRAQSRNRKTLLILLPHRLSSTHRQGDNTSDYTIIRSEVHILNYLTISSLNPSVMAVTEGLRLDMELYTPCAIPLLTTLTQLTLLRVFSLNISSFYTFERI